MQNNKYQIQFQPLQLGAPRIPPSWYLPTFLRESTPHSRSLFNFNLQVLQRVWERERQLNRMFVNHRDLGRVFGLYIKNHWKIYTASSSLTDPLAEWRYEVEAVYISMLHNSYRSNTVQPLISSRLVVIKRTDRVYWVWRDRSQTWVIANLHCINIYQQ